MLKKKVQCENQDNIMKNVDKKYEKRSKRFPTVQVLDHPNMCSDWLLGEKINEGDNAEIYEVCCGDDCDYIAKLIEKPDDQDQFKFKQTFFNEVFNHYILAKHQITPYIFDAFICPKTEQGYILMKKAGISIKDWFDKLKADERFTDDQLRQIASDLIPRVKDLVKHALKLGIVHLDMNVGNFMGFVDQNNLGEMNGLKMIDMGSSKRVNSEEEAYKIVELNDVDVRINTAINNRIKDRQQEREQKRLLLSPSAKQQHKEEKEEEHKKDVLRPDFSNIKHVYDTPKAKGLFTPLKKSVERKSFTKELNKDFKSLSVSSHKKPSIELNEIKEDDEDGSFLKRGKSLFDWSIKKTKIKPYQHKK